MNLKLTLNFIRSTLKATDIFVFLILTAGTLTIGVPTKVFAQTYHKDFKVDLPAGTMLNSKNMSFFIGRIRIDEVPTALSLQQSYPAPITMSHRLGIDFALILSHLGDVNSWINIAKVLMQLIRDNAPTAQFQGNTINIFPQGLQAGDLENWRPPTLKTFRVSAENLFGSQIVTADYTIAFNSGGTFRKQGKFIANASIIPSQIKVNWGYHLNAQVKFSTPVNLGSFDDPVAATGIGLSWSIASMFHTVNGENQFFITGNGDVSQLSRVQ